MGRKRVLKGDTSKVESTTESVMVADKPKREKKVKFVPYEGRDKLPQATLDDKGNILKKGDPRYYLVGSRDAGYKFIQISNSGRGITRHLYRILKPVKRSERGKRDRIFLEELKYMGFESRNEVRI